MFLLLFGTTAAAALNLGRIRSRSKLIYVGLFAGCVAAVLRPGHEDDRQPAAGALRLVREAGHQFLWATMAGFFMTGLLPFVEKPLRRAHRPEPAGAGRHHPSRACRSWSAARRAPTTTPSPSAGSPRPPPTRSAPAACSAASAPTSTTSARCSSRAISWRTRGSEGSRHEGLVPAMSTLVIIAHIEDGADLARQHHLPQAIIDMIQQHHGTTSTCRRLRLRRIADRRDRLRRRRIGAADEWRGRRSRR